MPLSRIGLHELKRVPDTLLEMLSPQIYVTVQQCNEKDNQEKGKLRVQHLQTILPHTKIGVRWFCGGDGDNQQSSRMTPEEYARDYFHLHVPRTLLMPDNEAASSKTDPNVVRGVVAWWVAVIRLATAAGIQLGIGCFPTGNPEYDQYKLLAPMFEAMRDAAVQGVVHYWRPNAYAVPSDPNHRFDHTLRHYREGGKVCSEFGLPFPPFFLGEFSAIGDYHDAEYGPRKMGMTGEQAARFAIQQNCNFPMVYYCAGDGIEGTGVDTWRHFDALQMLGWFPFIAEHGQRVPDDENERVERVYIEQAKRMADAYGNRIERGGVALRNMGTAKSLKVRASATSATEDNVIGKLVGGEELPYYDTVDGNGWRKIEFEGSPAFVFDRYVVLTPVVSPVDPAPPIDLPLPNFPTIDPTPEEAEQLAAWLEWLATVIRQRGARQSA